MQILLCQRLSISLVLLSSIVLSSEHAFAQIIPDHSGTRPLTEAQNWTINDRGQVVLRSAPDVEIAHLNCHP